MFPWAWWADPETYRGRQGKYAIFAVVAGIIGVIVLGWLLRHMLIQLIVSSVNGVVS